MQELHSYRAYLLSAGDYIRAVSRFESVDDIAACKQAELILEQSEYASIETRDGD
jgi:hypothetical protein